MCGCYSRSAEHSRKNPRWAGLMMISGLDFVAILVANMWFSIVFSPSPRSVLSVSYTRRWISLGTCRWGRLYHMLTFQVYEPQNSSLSYTNTALLVYERHDSGLSYTKSAFLVYGSDDRAISGLLWPPQKDRKPLQSYSNFRINSTISPNLSPTYFPLLTTAKRVFRL